MRAVNTSKLDKEYFNFIEAQTSIKSLKERAQNRDLFIKKLLNDNGFDPELSTKFKRSNLWTVMFAIKKAVTTDEIFKIIKLNRNIKIAIYSITTIIAFLLGFIIF